MRTVQFKTISISLSLKNTRLDNYILLVVNDSIKFLGRHT
ncbi:Uncharacterised protein [Segatella copri]|nr:Uncharacterised protein [Segatella copri]